MNWKTLPNKCEEMSFAWSTGVSHDFSAVSWVVQTTSLPIILFDEGEPGAI